MSFFNLIAFATLLIFLKSHKVIVLEGDQKPDAVQMGVLSSCNRLSVSESLIVIAAEIGSTD